MKLLKTILLVVCLSSLLACGGGSSDGNTSSSVDACSVINLPNARVDSANGRVKVINGQSCGNLAQSSVVRVVAAITDGIFVAYEPICTGTMISNNDVLTATHCFTNETLGGYPIISYGILAGEPGSAEYVDAVGLDIAPGFSESNDRLFNDAAVLLLERSPVLSIVPILLQRAPVVGETGYVFGYGQREQGSSSDLGDDFFTLEAGEMTIENVTPNHIFVVFSGSGTNVCFGDSGGPIIIPIDGTPTLAGVVSQGSVEGCVAGDVTTYTNMQSSDILAWLAEIVPDAAAY